jgi:glycosyltransferase involved in cell wall biosynthesis
MRPDVSVIIPLYNKEKYIQRTIDSVLRQTFRNFELIVVDSSDDGSTAIVQKNTDPRIRHIIREKRTFLPVSRNIGASLAQSELIAFIDADDEWTPEHLEALVALSAEFPDAGVYATPYIKLRPDGTAMAMIFANIPRPPWKGYISRYFRTCSRGDVPVCSSSSAVKKNIFSEIHGFDETLIYGGEDQHFWGRIALKYPVAFIWKGPAIYHTEASGRMCNDPHPFIGDPLSEYLKGLLTAGLLPSGLIGDINAYIRRRKKTVWISGILSRSVSNGSEEPKKSQSGKLFRTRVISPLMTLTGKSVGTFYDSQFHNACRRLWCYLHGWYIPAADGHL